MDFKAAARMTLLLVDDDINQLKLLALALRMSGMTVLTAGSAIEALSILAEEHARKVDVAVLDYEMPAMNGCVLASYLRARYPELKIILHSGALDIPEAEMVSVHSFVPKGDGTRLLLEEVSQVSQVRPEHGLAPPRRESRTFEVPGPT
jgi:DNA-binding NtrC family response regulator